MCIKVLAGIASQKASPKNARVAACAALLDRGWGKPHQTVGGEDGKDIRITIRKMLGKDDD
jgi:hypothetical protein